MHGLLAEVVVDAEDRVLREDLLQRLRQLARGLQIGAERLLDDDAMKSVAGIEIGRLQLERDRLVRLRRRRAVEDPVAGDVVRRVELLQLLAQVAKVVDLAEADRDVEELRKQCVQHAVVDRLRARELVDLLRRHLAKGFVRHLGHGRTDHRKACRQRALLGQVVDRRQQLSPAQVAGGAEDHHDRRVGDPVVMQTLG